MLAGVPMRITGPAFLPTLKIALLLVAALTFCTNAFALTQPDWRGEVGTTYQQWQFDTGEYGPMLPDSGYDNIYGDPLLLVAADNTWSDVISRQEGAWTLESEINILIPNNPDSGQDSYKEIWLQVVWQAAALDPFVWDRPMVAVETDPFYQNLEMTRTDSEGTNGWTETLFKITIWPNPAQEFITLKGDIRVDQIAIDTYCIPEPATIALLAGGAALVLRRKRNV